MPSSNQGSRQSLLVLWALSASFLGFVSHQGTFADMAHGPFPMVKELVRDVHTWSAVMVQGTLGRDRGKLLLSGPKELVLILLLLCFMKEFVTCLIVIQKMCSSTVLGHSSRSDDFLLAHTPRMAAMEI